MENNELFRKKAVERVSSPEWAAFGSIYTTVNGAGVVRDKNLVIYIKVSDRPSVDVGMDITVNGHKTVVREISPEPMQVGEEVSEYVLDTAGLESGDWTYRVEADTDLEDGVYEASITVESIHPIKFVTN